jgi:hypothetical protein
MENVTPWEWWTGVCRSDRLQVVCCSSWQEKLKKVAQAAAMILKSRFGIAMIRNYLSVIDDGAQSNSAGSRVLQLPVLLMPALIWWGFRCHVLEESV